MPGSHWMIASDSENFDRTVRQGLTVLGLRSRHRKKAERMLPGDRVLFFVRGEDAFAATATVDSPYFEDHAPIWVSGETRADDFPWRVRLRPNLLLEREEFVDAHQIAPRLLYVRRWAPEQWPLAFQGQVHLLSAQDFRLIEREVERALEQRRSGRGGGRRPDRAGPPASGPSRSRPHHRAYNGVER